MAGHGPPKSPDSRRGRQERRRLLPMEGRKGRAPTWPAGLDTPSTLEATLWRELWRTPQAVAWHELGWFRVVARYASFAAALSQPADLSATALKALATECRLLEGGLGLTPLSLRHLGWEIVDQRGNTVPLRQPGAPSGRDAALRVIGSPPDAS